MQLCFYLNQTRCTGCETCVVACKDWNDVPAGPVSWRRVLVIEKGRFPDPFVAFLPTSCYHCAQPSCIEACPVEAITKRTEDGIVLVNQEACLGRDSCDMCLEACPYNAPQFGPEAGAKMEKCDFCFDRWQMNQKPICVDACPLRALDAGPLEELLDNHGDVRDAEGFIYEEMLGPSIIFKPKLKPQEV